MEKPPMEWIDNLFKCLKEFYGERWTRQFNKVVTEDVLKSVWQSALQGLMYAEIRNLLILLKQAANSTFTKPPNPVEFYNLAKGKVQLFIKPKTATDEKRGDPVVARRYLDEINSKLRYRKTTEE